MKQIKRALKLIKEKRWGVLAGMVLVIAGSLLDPVGTVQDATKPKPAPQVQPLVAQVDGEYYIIGTRTDSTTTPDMDAVMALIISKAEDPGIRSAMEELGFTGPRPVEIERR